MDITDYILSKSEKMLTVVKEKAKGNPRVLHQFNSGSIEAEVGELLYSLVRLIQPDLIVETGTHKGISALYMALGLQKVNPSKGSIITYEVIDEHRQSALALWKKIGIENKIQSYLQSSLDTKTCQPIDLLLLDSEPQYRFNEFLLYWKWVRPGGFIIIHDLHSNLGHTGIVHHGMMDWPFGDFREKLSSFIREHKIQIFSLPTIRGLTVFQKQAPNYAWTNHIKGKL